MGDWTRAHLGRSGLAPRQLLWGGQGMLLQSAAGGGFPPFSCPPLSLNGEETCCPSLFLFSSRLTASARSHPAIGDSKVKDHKGEVNEGLAI